MHEFILKNKQFSSPISYMDSNKYTLSINPNPQILKIIKLVKMPLFFCFYVV